MDYCSSNEVSILRMKELIEILKEADLAYYRDDNPMAKQRMDIYGTLEYPLTIGYAAFIREECGTRRTSPVKHFIQFPSGVIYIETKNTRYILHPPVQVPTMKGVQM